MQCVLLVDTYTQSGRPWLSNWHFPLIQYPSVHAGDEELISQTSNASSWILALFYWTWGVCHVLTNIDLTFISSLWVHSWFLLAITPQYTTSRPFSVLPGASVSKRWKSLITWKWTCLNVFSARRPVLAGLSGRTVVRKGGKIKINADHKISWPDASRTWGRWWMVLLNEK